MRKIISMFLILMFVSTCAHAGLTWTKKWSSSDDGSTYGGANIGTIQDDVDNQVPTTAGSNTFTGTNTFSSAVTFSSTVTGISASKDSISRGFELLFDGPTQAVVQAGTLYHGTTQVDKTANDHVDVTVASDYITGVSERAVSTWLYVYVDSSGNCKLDDTAPSKSDASGNTAGTKYYLLNGSTYYRCIGAIRLNATGSGNIDNFYQINDLIMWDVPVSITTTDSTSWLAASCSAAIPSISTLGLFGLYIDTTTDAVLNISIRPTGSTWATDVGNSIAGEGRPAGQRWCATNASQSIDHIENTAAGNIQIDVEGYYLNIR